MELHHQEVGHHQEHQEHHQEHQEHHHQEEHHHLQGQEHHRQRSQVMVEEAMEEVMEEEVMVAHQCLIYVEMTEEVDMDNLQRNECRLLHNPDWEL